LPTLREYLGGRRTPGELRKVRIEDLIGRQSIELNSALISRFLEGKKVVVTGAGGSIGSELVRQIAEFQPSFLTLVDRDETALLLASLGVDSHDFGGSHETYLVDIRDKEAVGELFRLHQPDLVFHAAALKHLPALERFPREGWKTNVEGTLNVLEAARESGVTAFVNISTDKAANPANILGRSKRLAEELTGWFASQTAKTYVSVRFGNVLGSRGSLIPILAEQIGAGGPLTITDKDATRYFMSIPEACQLVLQAAAEGEGGDVLVLDMGEPVRIQEIAERMIELSGHPIDIVYTGLRPGEKLHEDLLSDSETPIPSSHPKIMRLKATPKSPKEVLAEKW
jgi:FlaA1/EpsC-like NDP-sugar epimerase